MRLLLLIFLCLSVQADFIWLEGEQANKSSVVKHGWYNSVNKDELSGGAWLSNFSKKAGSATYQFESKKAGSYDFWIRANSVAGPNLDWSLNGAAVKKVDFTKAEQKVNIASDNKPDMRFVSWVPVGRVTLKQGANVLKVSMNSKNNNHGGIDALIFSEDDFTPNGKMKPGQRLTAAMNGYWAFSPLTMMVKVFLI